MKRLPFWVPVLFLGLPACGFAAEGGAVLAEFRGSLTGSYHSAAIFVRSRHLHIHGRSVERTFDQQVADPGVDLAVTLGPMMLPVVRSWVWKVSKDARVSTEEPDNIRLRVEFRGRGASDLLVFHVTERGVIRYKGWSLVPNDSRWVDKLFAYLGDESADIAGIKAPFLDLSPTDLDPFMR